MLNITEGMIDRTLYPELDHILWDFHARLIALILNDLAPKP
ncbi:hypothetical protein SAMN02745127_02790 [Oceanospirillum multiglobuliferum]|nr:hypothetical protein [Oceanospirillum multiglobuliferum]SKA23886.1 hypothetical protein SAMN02745127_02790 [Oceanospirillum multiglobuliferum]